MSLVSLTFGRGKNVPICSEIEVTRPIDMIKSGPACESKVEVIKACTFFNASFVYIVGQILSGVVREDMVGNCNGKQFSISEVESKLGNAAKEGMNVGICANGIDLNDVKKGDVITIAAKSLQAQS